MSGLIKNALDYIEDLRTDQRCYLDERAVACIVSAAGWQAVGSTLGSLRSIIHALRGWPTPSSAAYNTLDPAFRSEAVFDPQSPDVQLDRIAQQLVAFAKMKSACH